MKPNRIILFSVALILGILIGNYLTTIDRNADRDQVVKNLNEVQSILVQTRMERTKDSVFCEESLERLSDMLYEAEMENYELKEKLGVSKHFKLPKIKEYHPFSSTAKPKLQPIFATKNSDHSK